MYVMDCIPIGQGHVSVSVQTQLNSVVLVVDKPGAEPEDTASEYKTLALVAVHFLEPRVVGLLVYPT